MRYRIVRAMTRRTFRLNLPLLAAASLIVGMMYICARPGLDFYFSADDVMNLRRAWTDPTRRLLWETFTFSPDGYRPVGLLWYKAIFSLAGLTPPPFQWVSFGFLVFNLVLLYALGALLTGSREIAILATLIGCFHSRLEGLYFNPGSIYDILCYTFYYGALVYYIRIRQAGQRVGWRPAIVFLLLNTIALSAKEMAVTLPVAMVAYELLYRPNGPIRVRDLWTWARLHGSLIAASGIMTGIFCFRKLVSSSLLLSVYRPQFSAARLFENWEFATSEIFYQHGAAPQAAVLALWISMVAVALLLKSRVLGFCLVLILVAPLPVCFIEARGLSPFYISMTGWDIYAATPLVWFRTTLLRWFAGVTERTAALSKAVLFLLTAVGLGLAHAQDRLYRFTPGGESEIIRDFKEKVVALHPDLPRQARILLLDDPFNVNEWTGSSILQLHYRNPDLAIRRMKIPSDRATVDRTTFDLFLSYRDGRLVELPGKTAGQNATGTHRP